MLHGNKFKMIIPVIEMLMKALEDIRKLIQKIIIVTALVDVSELALS
jgi:hypothetical protein